MWLYLEIRRALKRQLKKKSGWSLIQLWLVSFLEEKIRTEDMQTHGEDGYLHAKEKGPQKMINPADIFILDFRPPESSENRLLLFNLPSL